MGYFLVRGVAKVLAPAIRSVNTLYFGVVTCGNNEACARAVGDQGDEYAILLRSASRVSLSETLVVLAPEQIHQLMRTCRSVKFSGAQ